MNFYLFWEQFPATWIIQEGKKWSKWWKLLLLHCIDYPIVSRLAQVPPSPGGLFWLSIQIKWSFRYAPGELCINHHPSLPSANCMNTICCSSVPSEDVQDKDHVLHSPSVLCTCLIARARKMFTEPHRILKWHPDNIRTPLNQIKFSISSVSSILRKSVSNGIKDSQMKEKASLISQVFTIWLIQY